MKEVVFANSAWPRCQTRVSLHQSGSQVDKGTPITVCVHSGAAILQTYATRDELRALGEMLLRHANENETLQVAAA